MIIETIQELIVVVSDYQESSRFLIIFKNNSYAALLESCLALEMYETVNLSHCTWCYKVLYTGPDFFLCL
jgi:hypothetical protein